MQQGGKGIRQSNASTGEEIALIFRRGTNLSLGEGFGPPISEIKGISGKGELDRAQTEDKQTGEQNIPENLGNLVDFPSHTLGEEGFSFIKAQGPNPKITEGKNRELEILPSSATMETEKYAGQSQIGEAISGMDEGTNHGRKPNEGSSEARSLLSFPYTDGWSKSHMEVCENPEVFPTEIANPSQRLENERDLERNMETILMGESEIPFSSEINQETGMMTSPMETENFNSTDISGRKERKCFAQNQSRAISATGYQSSLRKQKTWARTNRALPKSHGQTPTKTKRQFSEVESMAATSEAKKAKVRERNQMEGTIGGPDERSNYYPTAEAAWQPCRSP
ncbi:hypothetical protein U1Q18_041708 [Sarracenia purpurea var. burkii]